jgi:hypothetical protein
MVVKSPSFSGATLDEAREWVSENLEDGAECPCCGQLAKLYKRKLNSSMARSLIWLVRHAGPVAREWVDVAQEAPKWLLKSRELPKLAHWGLIEEMPKDPDDTTRRTSGTWRPTEEGVDFVYVRIKATARVHLYNNTLEGFDEDEYITIKQALGKKFDYEELMNG